MSARPLSKALRASARNLSSTASTASRRSFVSLAAARPAVAAAPRAAVAGPFNQVRGVKTIDFAGVKEDVYGESFD